MIERIIAVIRSHPVSFAVAAYLGATFAATVISESARLHRMARDMERDFAERADEIGERMDRAYAEEFDA